MNPPALVWAIALTVQMGLPSDVHVDSLPSSPSVHIKVERHKAGNRNHHSGTHPQAAPKSPCTYNGLLVICTPPKPGRTQGALFTPGAAREAVANIPLPGLQLHVQPAGETLVNVATNFWAEPRPFATSIGLLGHTIDVKATPTSFTWLHGDGTSQTTRAPGRPYPGLDITHRYAQPAKLSARVVTAYAVRYSIDGGRWANLGQPLVAPGPVTVIDVHEATPVLSLQE